MSRDLGRVQAANIAFLSSHPIDIRLLPSIVPESGRNESLRVIGPELESRITKLKNLIDAGIVDDSTSGG